MKVMKFLVSKVKNFYKAISRFLLTIIFLLAAEIVNAININSTTTNYGKYILILVLGAFLSCVAEIVYERFFKKFYQRIICGFTSIFLTFIYYFVFISSGDITTEKMVRTIIIMFALLIAFIWLPILKTKISFNESFMVVFKSLFISAFFATVIWGGISLIIAAIDNLLFTVDSQAFSQSASIIYILFAPLYFLSLIPNYNKEEYTEEEKDHIEKMTSYGKFLEVLISYIFIPLASVFTLILIIYIVINFNGEFWKNSLLEPMLVAYSIVVILLYVLASTIKNRVAILFRMIFPKVLIPIVLFQTIASFLKVGDAGIPFTRYYVILYGLFAICAGIIFSIVSVKKNGLIAPILIGLLLISIIPPVDAFSVGKRNQINMLENILEKNNMLSGETIIANPNISDLDKEKITKNIEYLSMMGYENQVVFLEEGFNMYEDFKSTFGFEPYYFAPPIDTNNNLYAYYKDIEALDVSGYDRLLYGSFSVPMGDLESTILIGDFEIENNSYQVNAITDIKKGILTISSKDNEELLTYDLYSELVTLRNSISPTGQGEYILSLEEATFINENDIIQIKIILRNLSVENYNNTDNYYLDFYLLINIK